MTTEELIQWVDGAISVREDSYIKDDDGGLPYYSLNELQALKATRPENAKDYDESIAFMMIPYSNDITDWMKEIEEEKVKKKGIKK